MKRIVIAGATGFIGTALCRKLKPDYELIALSRSRGTLENLAKIVQWDAKSLGNWTKEIDGAFAIINLSGENIAEGRWTSEKKEKILHSRLDSSKALLEAIKQAKKKPKVAVIASAIGFYGSRGDEQLDEDSSMGEGFLADVCRQVEGVASQIDAAGVRCVVILSGIVLGSEGGVLARLVPMFRSYLGGYLGSGRQWSSWISMDDEINAIRFLMEDDNLRGVFNLTAPQPVTMKEFCEILGTVLKRPSWVSVPSFVIKAAFGEMADELFLASQKVLPKRLSRAGFKFKYPDLQSALESILR
jgi:uncharacterized protein (TIGR01777 family)